MKLISQKRKIIFTDLLNKYGKSVNNIKRILETRHKILKLSVASWASEMLIKEAIRRDNLYT